MNCTEKAIETLRYVSDLDTKLHLNIDNYDLLTAIKSLQEKAAREHPQPLTLEQLGERVCKPVFIVYPQKPYANRWDIVAGITGDEDDYYGQSVCFTEGESENVGNLGRHWIPYDHEPKEGA